MRALGFASAPGILRVLGFIPGFGLVVLLTAIALMVAAGVIGTKQALNYQSTFRAFGVCTIGLIISVVFQGLLFVILFTAFGVSTK
jgi:uncharacterized BrkB/YihY/UPF0761 family membrane protein